jgi:transposase
MSEIIRIGVDTSKHVFQLHGVDKEGVVVLSRRLQRSQMEQFFRKQLRGCVIALEACGAAHHWARQLQALGHTVRLLPPQYVKPYVKRSKTDAADAAAICEAAGRPGMRFVAVKSEVEQSRLSTLRVRDLLIKQRTMLENALRGHAAEFGVIGAKGSSHLDVILARARESIPAEAAAMLGELYEAIGEINTRLRRIDRQLYEWHCQSPRSRLLQTIPGVGWLTAITVDLMVPDPSVFTSARHFAAWVGLTPREHSTAGRQRLGGISRQGNETLRRLFVLGATAVIRMAKPGRSSDWLLGLLARKPRKLAAVALANKSARIIWAVLNSGQAYRRPQAA